ncbi:MAG: tRNA (adenosine(37)-N6)-dimethylallyltransferase MiaA [Desulfohalobiaceae bacterium]
MMQDSRQTLICLLGPTGTGKSSLAVYLARSLPLEVVNFDSRQVYADFPLITAQPGARERSVCSHWLYGFLECGQSLDAAGYSQLADQVLEGIQGRGNLALLVGGTGLYLKALLQGLAPVPRIPADIRQQVLCKCDELGPQALHQELGRVDPELAERLHPRDRQRITRAMEVYQATGVPLSSWQKQDTGAPARYQALKIGLWQDMQGLDSRLEERMQLMLQAGAEEEVRQAWENCGQESAPAWTGIGCRELLDYILGRCSLQEAKQQWLRRTRDYAKRQLTWFKKESQVHWFSPGLEQEILDLVLSWSEEQARL